MVKRCRKMVSMMCMSFLFMLLGLVTVYAGQADPSDLTYEQLENFYTYTVGNDEIVSIKHKASFEEDIVVDDNYTWKVGEPLPNPISKSVKERYGERKYSMSKIFYFCHLTSLDLSNFDTSSVTDMSGMFSSCGELTSLDLSKFDTSSVTDMNNMFYECRSLTSLDLSSFDTSSVTGMSGMFSSCGELTSLDLSKFDTSSVTGMGRMFYDCNNLTSLDLSSFDTSQVTNMNEMFYGCKSLTSLDISNFDISSVTYMSNMFYETCKDSVSVVNSIAESTVVATKFNSLITGINEKKLKFYPKPISTPTDPSELTYMQLRRFYTYTSGDDEIVSIKRKALFGEDIVVDDSYTWKVGDPLPNPISKSVKERFGERKYSMRLMFAGCYNLTSLDLSSFDTSSVTDMFDMFNQCSGLSSLDLSSFDTSSVTDMSGMFSGCSSLTSLDLSKFDTSSVTDMRSMFSSCGELTSLDLSKFDTSSVTDMSYMFYGCENLTSLDLSSFDTSSVTDMSSMFRSTCYNSESIVNGIAKDAATAAKFNSQETSIRLSHLKFIPKTSSAPTATPIPTTTTGTPTVTPTETKTPASTQQPTPTDNNPQPADTTVVKPGNVKLSSAKNSQKKTIALKWAAVSGAKGYEIQVAQNKKFSKGLKEKTTSGTSLKIKKLKKGKKYFVRVRAYSIGTDGSKVYGDWSPVKKVKIKK